MPSSMPYLSRSAARLLAGVIACGVLLTLFASEFALFFARFLPWRSEVKSAGTFFPAFPNVAPEIIERVGWIMIAAPMVALVLSAFRGNKFVSNRIVTSLGAGALALGTALWVGWLATPHNGFPSNARIHWVDFQTVRPDRYFYAAKRLPHVLFYEMPPVWQALNAAILVGLCVLIARQLGFSLAASVLLSAIVATSGNFLLFANTAEDVFINLALVLVVIAASLYGRAVWLGLALAVLLLGRPQFIVIFPAVALAELIVAGRRRKWPDRARSIHVATALAVAAAGTAVAQVVFSIVGDRYLFVNGQIIDGGAVEQSVAREIDGFTIYAFSGTYVTHLLWVLPTITLVLAAVAAVRATHLDREAETTVYFCGVSVVTMLALHEAQPLLYFNIRYLTYLFPFLVVMSWAAVQTVQRDDRVADSRSHQWIAPFVFVLAILAPLTIPADAVDTKRRLENRPETELLDVRDELRALAEGRTVFLDFPASSSQNYAAYVLRRGVDTVRLVDDGETPADGLVITLTEEPWETGTEVLTTERLSVFDVSATRSDD